MRQSTEQFEERIGDQVRALRISENLDQRELARRANVSLGSVQNLERGIGSSLRTLIKITRALGREDWLTSLDPIGTAPSPLEQLRAERGEPVRRQRVSRRRESDSNASSEAERG